jgi:hypothetical protein
MSNVASLELSKKLYELSGWGDTHRCYRLMTSGDTKEWRCIDILPNVAGDIPAFDLGYLLRKLLAVSSPEFILQSDGRTLIIADYQAGEDWPQLSFIVDTPEDAAAKLAIELFKQGVLTRGGDE